MSQTDSTAAVGGLSRDPGQGSRATSWPARTAAAVAPASLGSEWAQGDQQTQIGLAEVSAVLRD